LHALARRKGLKSAVFDGEIVVLDKNGLSSFAELQKRMLLKDSADVERLMKSVPVRYMIFDLLVLNGRELLREPYEKRRAALSKLKLQSEAWQTPEFFEGDSESLLRASAQMGFEGVIAKRRDSSYLPGLRSHDWLKLKNMRRQELVIAGYQRGEGARKGSIGSILLGYYDLSRAEAKRRKRPQKFYYAGECGTGFNQAMLKQLYTRLNALRVDVPPFENPPSGGTRVFAKPELVGEFQFTEWTRNNTLRHPSFKGLRTDKHPREIVREISQQD
jgi:bifunctional non-homologous end joining protein LigD